MFTLGTVRKRRVRVGREVAPRHAVAVTADVHVEALGQRPELFRRPQMPLAEERGAVAAVLQGLGEHVFLERRPVVERGRCESLLTAASEVVRGAHPGWVAAGHDAEPRRAAHRVRGICVGQKKCILLFGSTKKAVYVRNFLASYLGEESNRNITKGELRGLFQRTMPVWSVQTASCLL